jgi:hypothetical protein
VAGQTGELPNMRHAQRAPVGTLNVPIVNPTGAQTPPERMFLTQC